MAQERNLNRHVQRASQTVRSWNTYPQRVATTHARTGETTRMSNSRPHTQSNQPARPGNARDT